MSNYDQINPAYFPADRIVGNKTITLPMEAFCGRHWNEWDLNHMEFYQYQIALLQVEQVQRGNFCWFHRHIIEGKKKWNEALVQQKNETKKNTNVTFAPPISL